MTIPNGIAEQAKAILAGVGAAAGALALILTGDEGFADVSTAEWLSVIMSVLATYGVVWSVPNREV